MQVNGLFITAAVMLGLMTIALSVSGALRTRVRVRRRLRRFADMHHTEAAPEAAIVEHASRQHKSRLVAALDARYPLSGGARSTLIAVVAGAALGVGLAAAFSFFGASTATAVLVGTTLAGAMAWNVGLSLENAKRMAFNERLLPAIEDFQRMVHFGIATNQAFSSITSAAEEPLATPLRNVERHAELGVPLAAAVEREAQRVRMSELAMLSAIMATQTRTGGNLSEAVANLAGMLRERLDSRARLKASTAESRITLIILSGVPILAVGIQAALQPDLVAVLLVEARHLLGLGSGMIVGGLVVSWLMIRSAQR